MIGVKVLSEWSNWALVAVTGLPLIGASGVYIFDKLSYRKRQRRKVFATSKWNYDGTWLDFAVVNDSSESILNPQILMQYPMSAEGGTLELHPPGRFEGGGSTNFDRAIFQFYYSENRQILNAGDRFVGQIQFGRNIRDSLDMRFEFVDLWGQQWSLPFNTKKYKKETLEVSYLTSESGAAWTQ
ncbi:MAG: hypothetical protein WBA28_00450 [Microbacteriaceae bacterium]